MYIIRTKYFLTYTARFEIYDKPCYDNSTDKYKSYNKPMCVIIHNLKLNRNYQTKNVIMTLITDNTFYLFYKNKNPLWNFVTYTALTIIIPEGKYKRTEDK